MNGQQQVVRRGALRLLVVAIGEAAAFNKA